LNLFADIRFYASFHSLIACICSYFFFKGKYFNGLFKPLIIKRFQLNGWFEYFIFLVPLLTIVSIIIMDLITILFSAPANSDSMHYHLARVAYYLQHNNLNWFHSNQWFMVAHPKNSAVLFAYIYLISDFNENLTQFVQFIAYLITGIGVYGISTLLGLNKLYALVPAFLSLLLINLVLASTTTQNDLIITSFAAVAVYFILSYKYGKNDKFIFLFTVAAALMLGFKASAIMVLPVIALTTIYSFWDDLISLNIRPIFYLILFCIISFICLSLPSGYFENYVVYGHPIGSESMRKEHNFEGYSFVQIIDHGSKNMVRYIANFFCFDGFLDGPKFIYDANSILWKGITMFLQTIWPDIYNVDSTRQPFGTIKKIMSDEERVFFGPLGFLLMLPVTCWAFIVGLFKNKHDPEKSKLLICVVGFVVFLASQSFFGQFDPWRGRMFGTMAIFVLPLCGFWLRYSKDNFISQIYFCVVLVFSCWAAIWSILFREDSNWFNKNYTGKSLFKMNRLEQIMRDIPDSYEIYRNFEQQVPAQSTIVCCMDGTQPEYPLFGQNFTRKIITCEEYRNNPKTSDFLIYSKSKVINQKTDVHLGSNVYLRKIK